MQVIVIVVAALLGIGVAVLILGVFPSISAFMEFALTLAVALLLNVIASSVFGYYEYIADRTIAFLLASGAASGLVIFNRMVSKK